MTPGPLGGYCVPRITWRDIWTARMLRWLSGYSWEPRYAPDGLVLMWVRDRPPSPRPLITLEPDEFLNWECERCKSLTSTMLTRCFCCGTPRLPDNGEAKQ